mmetsp:Transcript_44899/g.137114  ORF Transcript_44899/g.137114 Transcript_44899/m.137114 type:complete len:200 (-) Transcript_44899:1163-1762(-)
MLLSVRLAGISSASGEDSSEERIMISTGAADETALPSLRGSLAEDSSEERTRGPADPAAPPSLRRSSASSRSMRNAFFLPQYLGSPRSVSSLRRCLLVFSLYTNPPVVEPPSVATLVPPSLLFAGPSPACLTFALPSSSFLPTLPAEAAPTSRVALDALLLPLRFPIFSSAGVGASTSTSPRFLRSSLTSLLTNSGLVP